MQPKIILVNPDLTYAAPPQMLQGFSGRTYATTRWNAAYNCHTVEMSPQEYEACWDDLRRAIHFQMRRWFPRFIVPERPLAVVEFEKAYHLRVAGNLTPEFLTGPSLAGWTAADLELSGAEPDALPSCDQKPGELKPEARRSAKPSSRKKIAAV